MSISMTNTVNGKEDLLAPLTQAHLTQLLDLAYKAGDAIMAVYNSDEGMGIEHKADDSPLTRADTAAHAVIVEGLRHIADLPIISEEAALPPFAERQQWSRYWLVDPLDGTKEFILRSGEFTVNIALIDRGEPVLGVVYLPPQRQAYLGVDARLSPDFAGAWKYTDEQPAARIRVRPLANTEDDTLIVLASHRHGTEAVNQLLAQVKQKWRGTLDVTNAGSSLKFCRIAEGLADFYPRLAPTSEWDTAAAQAVLSAAGGSVVSAAVNDNGGFTRLIYNQRDSALNPDFYALGDVGFDWVALLKG